MQDQTQVCPEPAPGPMIRTRSRSRSSTWSRPRTSTRTSSPIRAQGLAGPSDHLPSAGLCDHTPPWSQQLRHKHLTFTLLHHRVRQVCHQLSAAFFLSSPAHLRLTLMGLFVFSKQRLYFSAQIQYVFNISRVLLWTFALSLRSVMLCRVREALCDNALGV